MGDRCGAGMCWSCSTRLGRREAGNGSRRLPEAAIKCRGRLAADSNSDGSNSPLFSSLCPGHDLYTTDTATQNVSEAA